MVLYRKERRGLGIAFTIDVAVEPRPGALHGRNRTDTPAVAPDERVPQAVARRHPLAPRQMVEPQQVIVAHRAELGGAPRDPRRILPNRSAARCRATEAQAARGGPVGVSGVT